MQDLVSIQVNPPEHRGQADYFKQSFVYYSIINFWGVPMLLSLYSG